MRSQLLFNILAIFSFTIYLTVLALPTLLIPTFEDKTTPLVTESDQDVPAIASPSTPPPFSKVLSLVHDRDPTPLNNDPMGGAPINAPYIPPAQSTPNNNPFPGGVINAPYVPHTQSRPNNNPLPGGVINAPHVTPTKNNPYHNPFRKERTISLESFDSLSQEISNIPRQGPRGSGGPPSSGRLLGSPLPPGR